MVIDFHTHCFPNKLAPKAISNLSYNAGGLEHYTDGTVDGLLNSMDKYAVDVSAVMNIATNTHQQQAVNNFAASINNERIVAFGSVHPESQDVFEELERIKDMGLKGIKFHPEYQNFYVDEERMKPIYKKISQLGLITLFHAGYDVGFGLECRCSPKRLADALKWFDSPVIAAHWGGWCCWKEVKQYLCSKDVYFDTSMGAGIIPRPVAIEIIEKHGADKILFGTDTPWHTPKQEMCLLETLELSDSDKDKIYYQNAAKLLMIPNC